MVKCHHIQDVISFVFGHLLLKFATSLWTLPSDLEFNVLGVLLLVHQRTDEILRSCRTRLDVTIKRLRLSMGMSDVAVCRGCRTCARDYTACHLEVHRYGVTVLVRRRRDPERVQQRRNKHGECSLRKMFSGAASEDEHCAVVVSAVRLLVLERDAPPAVAKSEHTWIKHATI